MPSGLPFQAGPGVMVQHMAGQVIHSTPRIPITMNDIITDTVGVTVNPYIMGETAYGSSDWDNPTAPPSSDTAQTDTWDINLPPLDYPGGSPTFGVEVIPLRIVARPSISTEFYASSIAGGAVTDLWGCCGFVAFERKLMFNNAGVLVGVSAETEVAQFSSVIDL